MAAARDGSHLSRRISRILADIATVTRPASAAEAPATATNRADGT
jgi:hypothetical protein